MAHGEDRHGGGAAASATAARRAASPTGMPKSSFTGRPAVDGGAGRSARQHLVVPSPGRRAEERYVAGAAAAIGVVGWRVSSLLPELMTMPMPLGVEEDNAAS